MNYVIDTDVAIEYLRGNPGVVEELYEIPEVFVTPVTLAELFYGVYKSSDPVKHEKKLRLFIDGSNVLGPTESSCKVFGLLKSRLRKGGRYIDDFDLLIASIAISNGFTLITNNYRHFQGIDGLKIKTTG